MLTQEQYDIERAICDKAQACAEQFKQKNGWIVVPAEAAKHPDYAACDNEMRGRVELFELHRDRPDAFVAYVTGETPVTGWKITTFTGGVVSRDLIAGQSYSSPRRSFMSNRITPITVLTTWGDWYTGRALGAGLYVKLRKLKHAPR